MAQLEHETNKVVPALEKAINAERTFRWANLLVLLSLIAGMALLFAGHNDSGMWRAFLNEQWRIALIALAAMALGFGGAALLYQRLGHRQADQLAEDYLALVARADTLLKLSEPSQHERESDSASLR